ncbi:hypothetical protein YTPLAS18_19360 [Nitrospira sp.]|nr:hypothetical protein YTPLAS18_19360 [Nitrospira sp.]
MAEECVVRRPPGKGVTGAIGRSVIDGTVRNLMAEALFPITGLITAAYLTRQLGPESYGRLSLVVALIAWVEWAINSFFSRAVVKHIGEVDDWRPLGTAAIQLQLRFGLGAMVALWGLAYPLSSLLHEPSLAGFLLILAIDTPLFVIAQAHRHVLIGTGHFAAIANTSAIRWVVRLVLILLLVALGLSIYGVLLGILGSTTLELWLLRRVIRPSLLPRTKIRDWPLWNYSIPLFVSALSVATMARVDLFFLSALRPEAGDEIGWYGAAQNLSMLPGLLGMTMVPILLSSLSRLRTQGDIEQARVITINAIRVVWGLLPFMTLIGGCAIELVVFLFGTPFAQAGTVLPPLMLGGTAMMLLAVAMTILIAEGHPTGTVLLSTPMVIVAAAGHLFAIPRYGMEGAAWVTAGTAILAAMIGAAWAVRAGHALIPWGTIARSVGLALMAFALGRWWPAPGIHLLVKLAVVSGLITLGYWMLRELSRYEIGVLKDVMSERILGAPAAGSTLGRTSVR